MGLAAVETQQLGLLRRLFTITVRRRGHPDHIAILSLPPVVLADVDFMQQLDGMARHYVPLNDWIYGVLETHVGPLLADKGSYELLFDRFEILTALSFGALT